MVRHIVLWKLKDYDASIGNAQTLPTLQQCIADMRTNVPGLLKIELGVDRSRTADSADLVLYSEFDSWDALDRYQMHPLHDEFRRLLGPLRSERRVADYD